MSLGPAIAFTIGSLVLLGATALLRQLHAKAESVLKPVAPTAAPLLSPPVLAMLGLILGTGFGVGIGATLTRKVLTLLNPPLHPGLLMSLFIVAHLLTVVPAGLLAERLGNHRAMLLALGAMAGLVSLLVTIPGTAIVVSLLLGLVFSVTINGAIPLALSLVPSNTAGLSVGIYFAGTALASSLSGMATNQLNALPIGANGLFAVLALLVAGGCVALSDRLPKRPTTISQG